MDLLNVNLCVMVSPRELFRIESFQVRDVYHPDDLAGFANLQTLEYSGMLDYLNLTHTPELRQLTLREITHWPDGFAFPHLPRLEELDIHIGICSAAGNQIFRQGTAGQIFGNLMGLWPDNGVQLEIHLSYFAATYDNEYSQARRGLVVVQVDVSGYDVEALAENWMVDQYGEDWREYWADRDQQELARLLDEVRAYAIEQNMARQLDEVRAHFVQLDINVDLDSNAPPCQF